MSLPGKSKTIIAEPLEQPQRKEKQVPEKTPVQPVKEPVPA